MKNAISNFDVVIDSRDVLERIEALESELMGRERRAKVKHPNNWILKPGSKTRQKDENHTLQDSSKELLILKALADERRYTR